MISAVTLADLQRVGFPVPLHVPVGCASSVTQLSDRAVTESPRGASRGGKPRSSCEAPPGPAQAVLGSSGVCPFSEQQLQPRAKGCQRRDPAGWGWQRFQSWRGRRGCPAALTPQPCTRGTSTDTAPQPCQLVLAHLSPAWHRRGSKSGRRRLGQRWLFPFMGREEPEC